MNRRKKQCGMSVFGVVIVMIIAGVLLAALTPMLLSKHTYSMAGSDRKALEAAKTAIIGYAFSTGRLPLPTDAANAIIDPALLACNPASNPKYGSVAFGSAGATACLMPPSAGTGTGVVAALGVNNWGVFGRENVFHMDVNSVLASLPAASGVKNLCSVAQAQLMANPVPRVCQNDACTASAPMAFVLYSTGADHVANLVNAGNTRIYESDNRGIDNSPDDPAAPPPHHYDDQVVSYPLSSLVKDCAKLSGLPVCNLAPATQTITLGSTATLTASCSNNPSIAPACPTPYTWTSSDITNAPVPAGTGGNVTPTAAGTYTYTVAACNEFGAGPQSTAAKVFVTSSACTETAPPLCPAPTATPSTIAAGGSSTLAANCTNNPTSWSWSNDTSSPNPAGAGGSVTLTTTTNYSVQASNCFGTGVASSPTKVTVTPACAETAPVCTPTATPSTIAAGGSSTLAANCTNNPTSWSWSNDTSSTNPTGAGGSVTLTATTNYSVQASNCFGAGASGSTTVTVAAGAPPVCTMTPATLNVQTGALGTLTATCTNNPTYAWNVQCLVTIPIMVNGNPAGQSCTFNASSLPNALPNTNTVTVTATNLNGAGTASAQVAVSACLAGQIPVYITNNAGGKIYYALGGCPGNADSIEIPSAASVLACGTSGTQFLQIQEKNPCNNPQNLMLQSTQLGTLDTNANGVVTCTVPNTNVNSATCN